MKTVPSATQSFRIARALTLACLTVALAGTTIPVHAQTYTDLHDFNASAGDPSNFNSNKLAQGRDGNLYTESISGGTSGGGTVFKITPTGTPTIIYSLNSTSGYNPLGGLTLGPDGNFYGDATQGGSTGNGTDFKVTPGGALNVLHNFAGTTDTHAPTNALVLGADGKFYGTTDLATPGPIIYSVTSGGIFTVLHTLSASEGYEGGQLFQGSDGDLYGAMNLGGANGQGTAYKMTTNGVFTVLHNFKGSDGTDAASGMVQASDGNYYGVASLGGTSNAGAIYRLTSSGSFKILHNLNGTSDGSDVLGIILATDGNLYGIAINGGSSNCGTIFRITTGGVFTSLHSFDNTHGCHSITFLTERTDGLLYGLATNGGAHGNGVFFSLNVGLKPFVTLSPTSGKVGTKVGIMGQGFDSTSVVEFGGVKATAVTLTGTTYITATVPAGAIDGFVTVTTGATTLTSSQQFTVHDSWSMGKAMPTARFGAFAGAIGTNIYVVGGATNSGYQVTNVNEIYNTLTNTWKTGAPDPTSRELGASAVVNGILYVIGGSTSGSNPLTLVEAYNPVTNSWTTKASMPTARNSMPAVVDKNIIYVIGGYDPNTQFFYDTVESYNTTTNTWTEEKPLPVGTAWEAVGLLGTTIVAADGQVSPGTVVGSSEGYNPSTNTWTALTADPTPRLEACFAAINGQLYVAGGANSTAVLSVNEAYNATTKKWTTLASLPNALATAGSATVGGRLYCFGGANSYLSTVYNYVQIYQS
jgi:uncharacterized repeat protein (TIGR03803 family)